MEQNDQPLKIASAVMFHVEHVGFGNELLVNFRSTWNTDAAVPAADFRTVPRGTIRQIPVRANVQDLVPVPRGTKPRNE